MTDFFNVGQQVAQTLVPISGNVFKQSLDADAETANTGYTKSRTTAQDLANTNTQDAQTLRKNTDKNLVSAWVPTGGQNAPSPAQPQPQANPAPSQNPQVATQNGYQAPQMSLGSLSGQSPLSANPTAPQVGQYQPGTLANQMTGQAPPTPQAPQNFPGVNPSGVTTPPVGTVPYQAGTLPNTMVDHPAAAMMSQAGNTADTSAAATANPDYNPVQITPQGTFDRAKFIQGMIDDGHGLEAMKWQNQFKLDDATAEKAKLEQSIAFNAKIAAKSAALLSLPEEMQPAAWQQEVKDLTAMGVPLSALNNGVYDPNFIKTESASATTQVEKDKKYHEVAQDNIATLKQAADEQHQIAQEHQAAAELTEKNRHNLAEEDNERAKIAKGEGGPDSTLVGKDYLNTLPQSTQNYLKGAATGQIPVNPRSKEGQAIIKGAAQAYPDVNISAATKFSQELGKVNAGTSGGVAVGANKTYEHIGTMADLDQGPGSGVNTALPNVFGLAELANRVGNKVVNPQNENAWNAAHSATVNEMARSFKGGPPGESEAARDMKNLKYSDPIAYKQKVYQTYAALLQGQVEGVENQRQAVYGSADPGTSLLTSRSQAIAARLNGGTKPAGLLPAFDDPNVRQQQAQAQGNTSSVPQATPQGNPPGVAGQTVRDGKTYYLWSSDNNYHTALPQQGK